MENTTRQNEILWKDRKHFMWFPFSFTTYQIKNERLYEEKGFFSTTYDEVLLYRITDLTLKRSLAQKLFGTGTIELYARGDSQPHIFLLNIKKPKDVKDMLSNMVEDARRARKVVGREFYGDDAYMNQDCFRNENYMDEED